MRLDFNIAFIDDEIDTDDSDAVDELIKNIKDYLFNKGFQVNELKYSNSESCFEENSENKRIDLYISDNNLSSTETGIDLYLELKSKFICDFILYTRSDKSEIIQALVQNLQTTEDPNIFTRFTFLNRGSTNEWHKEVYNVIDHIISKREELNNLRGLYAQISAKIHNKLCDLLQNTEISFHSAIEQAFDQKIISNKNDKFFKRDLTFLRDTRNGLIHGDEIRNEVSGQYEISYYIDQGNKLIITKEDDFSSLRTKVLDIKSRFFTMHPE